jgi:hypothetical protein
VAEDEAAKAHARKAGTLAWNDAVVHMQNVGKTVRTFFGSRRSSYGAGDGAPSFGGAPRGTTGRERAGCREATPARSSESYWPLRRISKT